MLTIGDSALKTAKNNNCDFIVKIIETPSCWGVGKIRQIQVGLCKNFTNNKNEYNAFQYEGVNVYISKELLLRENVEIYQKHNIPFFGPTFRTKGIFLKPI